MAFLQEYVARVREPEMGTVGPDTSLFWSTWGQMSQQL